MNIFSEMDGGDGLEEQIRARWGQYGNWKSADQDQVSDFARLLRANGITDLSKLNFKKREYERPGQEWETEAGTQRTVGDKRTAFDVLYDGQAYGFLGNINRDGSLGKLLKDYRLGLEEEKASGRLSADDIARMLGESTDRGDNGPIIGWSSRGRGHTNFNLVELPNGEVVVMPNWGSSKTNTFKDIRGAASIGALALGAYYAPASGVVGSAAQGALQGYGTAVAGDMLLNPNGDVNSVVNKSLVGAGTGAIAGAGKYYADQYFSTPSSPSGAPKDYTSAINDGVRDMASQPLGPGDVPDFNLPPVDPSIGGPAPTAIPTGPTSGVPSTPTAPNTPSAPTSGLTNKQVLYGGENYGPYMSGTQTSIYDGVLKATGSTALAGQAANIAGAGGDWASWLKTAWDGADTFLNSGLGKALVTGAGLAGMKNAKQGAPDPMLQEGAGKVKAIGDSATDRANANDDYFNSVFLPRYLSMMDKASSREDELFNWNMGRARLAAGQMDKFYAGVDAYDNLDNREKMAGEAMATARQANDANAAMARRRMQAMGINPNSGAYGAMMGQMANRNALNEAMAANMVRDAARKEGINLRATAAGLRGADMGYTNNALGSAGLGMDTTMKANSAWGNNNSQWNATTGMGLNAYGQLGSWGMSRSNSADQLNAANVAGWNGLIGYGLGRMWGG